MSAKESSAQNVGLDAELRQLGAIHVTGLTVYDLVQDEDDQVQSSIKSLGFWDTNGKDTVIILLGGEVWLLSGEPDGAVARILSKACPNGKGAYIPGSDGKRFDCEQIRDRVRDSYSARFASPIPEIRH
jgi:hypothetical protein